MRVVAVGRINQILCQQNLLEWVLRVFVYMKFNREIAIVFKFGEFLLHWST